MTTLHRMRPVRLLPAFSLLFALACSRDNPEWRHDRIVVAGHFDSDGTCTVTINGQPLLPAHAVLADDSTRYHRRFASNVNMAPGEDLHVLACGGLQLSFRWFADSLLPARAFPIDPGVHGPAPRGFVVGYVVGQQITAGEWRSAFPSIGAKGWDGKVELTQVDSAHVVGVFEFIGRRESSM